MNRIFTDDARQEEFDRQGYIVVRLLSATDAAALLCRIEELRKTVVAGPGCADGLDQSFCTPDADYRRRADEIVSEALREPLLSMIAGYRLAACGVMIKRPHAGEMDVHRDRTVHVEPDLPPVNAWCPLVDVDDSYGNLAMLPGSHKLPNIETKGVKRFYAAYDSALKRLSVSVPLSAGEAILFDNRLLHWSRPNRHDEHRPVLRAMAVPAESRIVFYKLDAENGGKRFEIVDAEAEGAVTHSPDDIATGLVPAPTIGFVVNENREVSLLECWTQAAQASGRPLVSFAVQQAVNGLRARLGG